MIPNEYLLINDINLTKPLTLVSWWMYWSLYILRPKYIQNTWKSTAELNKISITKASSLLQRDELPMVSLTIISPSVSAPYGSQRTNIKTKCFPYKGSSSRTYRRREKSKNSPHFWKNSRNKPMLGMVLKIGKNGSDLVGGCQAKK